MARPVSPSELRDALHKLGNPKEWDKELRKTYRVVGKQAAGWARFEAAGSSDRRTASAADAIKGTATPTAARLTTRNTPAVPYANAAFYGAKRRTGWYAAERYSGSEGRQFRPWVGNSWTIATRGQGPYSINDSLADHIDDIAEQFQQTQLALIERAFPRGTVR